MTAAVLRRLAAAALLVALLLPAHRASAARADDFAACGLAAERAEAAWQLPPGLLMAIGREESGRWNEAAQQVTPWPFAANAAGASRFFQTVTEAVDYVGSQQRAGIASIDVGCFQINLQQHPAAFATLQEAFDPDANARYAARFLSALYAQTGSWPAAVGRYHSATEALAQPYAAAVLAQWKQPALFRQAAVRVPERAVAGMTVQRPGDCFRPAAGLPHVVTPTLVGYRPHQPGSCG